MANASHHLSLIENLSTLFKCPNITNLIDIKFLDRTPVAEQLRERTDKWGYIKLKSFCTTVTRLKK
jgi:hypothetical protein